MRRKPNETLLSGLRRRPVLEVTLACLVLLLLAQALIGALSLSALKRLMLDATADRVEVVARRIAHNIDNGVRLGKPLAQYFGLDQVLQENVTADEDTRGAAVYLADGTLVALVGIPSDQAALMAKTLVGALPGPGMAMRASGASVAAGRDTVTVAVPIKSASDAVLGAVAVTVDKNEEATRRLIINNVRALLLITLAIGLALSAVFKYLVPPARLASDGRARFVVPLLALLLAQGVYATYTIASFKDSWIAVTRDNVGLVAEGMQQELNRVLAYGVPLHRLKGVDAPFSRLAATFPAVAQIELVDQSGTLLARADARGALPVQGRPEAFPHADALTLVLPLCAQPVCTQAQGHLVLRLSADYIADGVRSRVLDAATVAGVAAVAAIEMLLLLALLMNRAYAARAAQPKGGVALADDDLVGRLARPVMFGFLFSWALPLGFLPLYARSLPAQGLSLPPSLLLALPISVEMACGMFTSLLAGRLTDRRGWQVPVLCGLAVSCAGMLASALASNLLSFSAARGLVGLGYGLTWMGLYGLIATRSPPFSRGRNMTEVVAGLYAGHLSGAAVGAMLVEQLGFRVVFGVGALALIIPLAGVLVLMHPYMSQGRPAAGGTGPSLSQSSPIRLVSTFRLVFSRDFGMLLAGSIIPFSIAQVGLLSFALPLYLEAQGVVASSVGRVLMIYGVCVIYLGPLMGRVVDRSRTTKGWIALGGLVGSTGLLGMYWVSGLPAAAAAVLMLALASCLAGASQSSYMLSLPRVRDYGAAGATSVMRAADKLGQMCGPLVMGVMFGLAGMEAGLAVAGALYLLATLAFVLFAPGNGNAPHDN